MTDHQTDHQTSRPTDAASQDVFDIANWLERAGRRDVAPAPSAVSPPPVAPDYVPRHRSDVAADSVA